MATIDPGGTDAGGRTPQQPSPNSVPISQQQTPVNLDPSLQGKLQAIRDSLGKINEESDSFVEKLGEVSTEFEGLEDTVDQLSGKRKKAAAAELADIDVILKARLDALSKEDKEQVKIEQDYQRRVALQRSAAQREVARAIGERRAPAEIAGIESGYAGRIAGISRPTEGLGGMISQAGSIMGTLGQVASLIASSTVFKQATTLPAATAQAQAALLGAGVGSVGGGILGGAINAKVLSPVEAQNLIKTLADLAPRAFDSSKGLNTMIGVLGKFGSTVEESMATLEDASSRLNWTTTELAESELYAADIHGKLGMSVREAQKQIINMTEAARAGGAGVGLVASVLRAFDGNLKQLGMTMSQAEAARFAQSVASGLANMPIQNLVGLAAFQGGKGLPGNVALENFAKNPAPLLQNLFNQTIRSMPGGLAVQLPALEKIAGFAGINIHGAAQDIALKNMLESAKGLSAAGLKDVLAAKGPTLDEAAKSGWQTVTSMKDPLTKISNNVERLTQGISMWLGNQMQGKLGQGLGAAVAVGGEATKWTSAAATAGSLVAGVPGAIAGAGAALAVGAGLVNAAGRNKAGVRPEAFVYPSGQ